ncbi:Polyketide synthase, enoylreductase [Penicillium italicum]|uniref:Polyketide synthase, enoylreductase n=1 Tax=Penicillium italicum TaxID=40296 RepID=A0A0A2KBS3_PENIT|nr:Polyketide synthase, enoylreductase [Penicillium italicum]
MPSTTVSLPKYQTAIVAQGPGKLAIKNDILVPALEPDMAIVKTAAVAINPVDAKMLDYSPAAGAVHGYDFSGTVVALGSDVPSHLAVGDRVAGFVHGMNSLQPGIGAFSEYVGACADILLKIPDHMSFEDAAGLGTGVATAVLGLFRELQIPGDLNLGLKSGGGSVQASEKDFVLVAGGSTATGTRAIQLLKLAGLRPIVTCSPSNFDLVYHFGAEKAFDYHSPNVGAEIRAYTSNTLAYALDCVSLADTTQLCYGAIGRAGGRYVALEPFREAIATTRPTIEPSWVMVLTIFGRKVALDGVYGRDARPEERVFGAQLFKEVQNLLDCGLIDPHPVKALPGGWEGVIEGVDKIRNETLSGYKLVYPVL